MRTPLRKVLNLTFAWLVDLIGGTDEWKKEYEPIFRPPSAAVQAALDRGEDIDLTMYDVEVVSDAELREFEAAMRGQQAAAAALDGERGAGTLTDGLERPAAV